ncbi:MAG: class I SAM-dependent methyltransferase [Caldilineaceae bacterium]
MRSTHNGGHDYLPSSAMTAAPRSPTAVIDALNDEGKAPGHVNEGKAPGHVNSSGVVGKEIGEVRFSTVDHSGKGRLMDEKFLSRSDVKSFYDRLGIGQDWQRFYEGAAIRALCDNGKFTTTDAILELGCGTGAFALDLFQHYLPPTAWYLGLDISSTMVDLARERLAGFGRRAQVWLTDGALTFPFRAASFDRWVANYVLDLLPPDDIRQVLAEAHRLLKPRDICAW